jgi:hypothetical protein
MHCFFSYQHQCYDDHDLEGRELNADWKLEPSEDSVPPNWHAINKQDSLPNYTQEKNGASSKPANPLSWLSRLPRFT